MRLIILFIGLLIADSMTIMSIVPQDPESAEAFLFFIAALAGYSFILDITKKV